MKRRLGLCLLLLLLVAATLTWGGASRAQLGGAGDVRALDDAITEIDLERAGRLASSSDETPQFLY